MVVTWTGGGRGQGSGVKRRGQGSGVRRWGEGVGLRGEVRGWG